MTLEELESIYNKAWAASGSHREGIRVVVEALRDEMSGASRLRDIEKLFNKILNNEVKP